MPGGGGGDNGNGNDPDNSFDDSFKNTFDTKQNTWGNNPDDDLNNVPLAFKPFAQLADTIRDLTREALQQKLNTNGPKTKVWEPDPFNRSVKTQLGLLAETPETWSLLGHGTWPQLMCCALVAVWVPEVGRGWVGALEQGGSLDDGQDK